MDYDCESEKITEKNDISVDPLKSKNIESVRSEQPAEKGVWRWFVLVASFVCNGLVFGLINSVSVIYNDLQSNLESQGVEKASTKASLVGSLGIGTTFLFCAVAGVLTDQIGIRRTTFLGGFLATLGLFASSFFTDSVEILYFTYGVVLGIGASLAYAPSLVILGHYFSKYLGVANGLVTAGSSVFTLAFPYALDALIKNFGLSGCFRGLAILMSLLMVCAFIFKPVISNVPPPPKKKHNHTFRSKLSTIINVEIWKKKKFLIWTTALPIALFGYFVTYVHLVKFVDINYPGYDGKILIQCIAITSLLGRLVFGKLADLPKVNRIFLQQMSFIFMGVLTMLIVAVNNFYLLIAISLGMGIFDGCFVSLVGPVAFDICGQQGASQAIGFVLGLCSFPMTLGPPIVGFVYDQTHSYTISFVISGLIFLIGASIIFLMRCVKDEEPVSTDPAAQPLRQTSEMSAPSINGDPQNQLPTYRSLKEGKGTNGNMSGLDSGSKSYEEERRNRPV
ncbi:UNVERIFIED_CONTAM: hypothetical protein PYX00_004013 [Menopon gallinae]|uniref:Major facilitator superfamily (MFS) profile domain-containing protein n=1 Tax=Menopon gallinae TaxID=328185 RepID=A0AAW2I2L5_9NEOP